MHHVAYRLTFMTARSMSDPGALLRATRVAAGVTQAELGRRLGRSQAAIAHLERPGRNPRVGTVDAALRALGARLELRALPKTEALDEKQIEVQLRLTPAERAAAHDAAYRNMRETVARARRLP